MYQQAMVKPLQLTHFFFQIDFELNSHQNQNHYKQCKKLLNILWHILI